MSKTSRMPVRGSLRTSVVTRRMREHDDRPVERRMIVVEQYDCHQQHWHAVVWLTPDMAVDLALALTNAAIEHGWRDEPVKERSHP